MMNGLVFSLALFWITMFITNCASLAWGSEFNLQVIAYVYTMIMIGFAFLSA